MGHAYRSGDYVGRSLWLDEWYNRTGEVDRPGHQFSNYPQPIYAAAPGYQGSRGYASARSSHPLLGRHRAGCSRATGPHDLSKTTWRGDRRQSANAKRVRYHVGVFISAAGIEQNHAIGRGKETSTQQMIVCRGSRCPLRRQKDPLVRRPISQRSEDLVVRQRHHGSLRLPNNVQSSSLRPAGTAVRSQT